MNLLDEFRDGVHRRAPLPGVPLVDRAALPLPDRTRRTMWWLFGMMLVLGIAHPFIASGLSTMTNGADLPAAGLAVLSWPAAFIQPALCGAVAVWVIALAIVTRGFSRRGSGSGATATAATVAGVVAGLPTVAVIVVAMLIALLAAAVIVAIVWFIFAAASS